MAKASIIVRVTQTRKRDSFEVEISELDMVLWAEAKEEVRQGNDTARSRFCMPCGRSKGARRSAKFVGRWGYRSRRFTVGSGDTRGWDCTSCGSSGNCAKKTAS